MKVKIMRKIKVESMSQEDIQDIVDIEKTTFSIPWTYESFIQELANPHAHYIVLKCDDHLIGYGGFWKILDEGHITNVAITSTYRGLGYGTMLIKALLQEAKKLKIQQLTLEVRESNLRAIKAYEQLGFTIEGRRRRYYTKPIEDAMIMWLSL